MFLVIQVITPDFYASVWHEDLTKICLAVRRRLDGDRQLHHVPHGQLQGSERWIALDLLLDDGNSTMVAVLVFLAAGTLAFSVMAVVRVHGSVKRRAANIGRVDELRTVGGRRPLAAAFEHEGRAAGASNTPPSTMPAGNTDEIKVLRRRMIQAGIYDPRAVGLFLPRPHRACGRPRRAGVHVRADGARQGRCIWLLIGLGGIVGYLGAEPLYRQAHQGARSRAPGRLPGFHGPAGGLRRCRA